MSAYRIGSIMGTLLSPFIVMLILGGIYYLIKQRRISFRRAVFNRWTILIGVLWLFIGITVRMTSSLEQDSSHVYPEREVKSFIASCVDSANDRIDSEVAERICACAITDIQKAYSFREFKDFSIQMSTNKIIPDAMKNIMVSCSETQS